MASSNPSRKIESEFKMSRNVVTIRDFHMQLLMQKCREMDYDFDTMKDFFTQHHLVHPDVARGLMECNIDDSDRRLLSSVFVSTEPLVALLNRLEPKHSVYRLLAVDGLCDYELVNYLKNLQIPNNGYQDAIGQGIPIEKEVRWTHVQTIRKLYHYLEQHTDSHQLVYRVIAPVLVPNYSAPPEPEWICDLQTFYKNSMGPFKLSMLIEP